MDKFKRIEIIAKMQKNQPHGGLDPPAFRLKVWRSTNWASEALVVCSLNDD